MQSLEHDEILMIIEQAEVRTMGKSHRFLMSAVVVIILIICCQGG
jgi:hypothetical protein